jgi:hypothetical protein
MNIVAQARMAFTQGEGGMKMAGIENHERVRVGSQ